VEPRKCCKRDTLGHDVGRGTEPSYGLSVLSASRVGGERRSSTTEPFSVDIFIAYEKEDMRHASECVRLAGLTDDITVRDQLVKLAEGWISTAHQDRRSAQVIALHPQQSSSS
jgi:hypothetical protein